MIRNVFFFTANQHMSTNVRDNLVMFVLQNTVVLSKTVMQLFHFGHIHHENIEKMVTGQYSMGGAVASVSFTPPCSSFIHPTLLLFHSPHLASVSFTPPCSSFIHPTLLQFTQLYT